MNSTVQSMETRLQQRPLPSIPIKTVSFPKVPKIVTELAVTGDLPAYKKIDKQCIQFLLGYSCSNSRIKSLPKDVIGHIFSMLNLNYFSRYDITPCISSYSPNFSSELSLIVIERHLNEIAEAQKPVYKALNNALLKYLQSKEK